MPTISLAQARKLGMPVPKPARRKPARCKPSMQPFSVAVSRVCVCLPWPPSANTYWRHVGAKVLISAAGRRFRKAVVSVCYGLGHVEGRLAVRIWAHVPDQRRRDLDNLLKATLDALQRAGVYADDAAIDRIEIERVRSMVKGGSLRVEVQRIEEALR